MLLPEYTDEVSPDLALILFDVKSIMPILRVLGFWTTLVCRF